MSHGRDTSSKAFGVVAEFETPEALLDATVKTRAQGYRDMDAFSPIPVHGLVEAMEFKDDRLGPIVFVHGILGFCVGMGLEFWVSKIAYPHNVGGKPLFSLPAFVPVAFECTILFAAAGAVMGMFALNGLPKPHHPVFNAAAMVRASQDRFVLLVEATDPRYNEEEVSSFFRSLNPLSVERVRTSEGY